MNTSILSGKWKEIKGEVQKTWGDFTGDEFDRTEGNVKALIGLVEQKFGIAKDVAEQKINELLARYSDKGEAHADAVGTKVEAKADSISDKVNGKIENAKNTVRDAKIPTDDRH